VNGWRARGGETPDAPQVTPVPTDAVKFAREWLDFHPDERQAEVLLSESKRGILNCTRQWGKSTVAAAKAVHRAFTRPKCLVLVASPSHRQSAEFVRKAAGMVQMQMLGIKPRGDGANDISIELPNRSRIVGLPGVEGTVRGFSAVSLMLIDEASRVDDVMYQFISSDTYSAPRAERREESRRGTQECVRHEADT